MMRPTGPRPPGLPPIGGAAHPDFRGLALAFTRLFRGRDTGGAALAVYHRGELVADVWGGYRDLEFEIPWEPGTMAMSFSTTKGATATVIHRLADRGLIDYDAPVAAHWEEFGGGGRDGITVRQLLSHQAGLHRLRGRLDRIERILDHEHMIDLVAETRPAYPPGTRAGYHGITFGWLLAGLARAVTGRDMAELFRTEIAEPLELDGLYLGAPADERHRVAPLFPESPPYVRWSTTGQLVNAFPPTHEFAEALIVRDFDRLWFERDERRILEAQIPAVNGVFTARSLARLYAALAGGGEIDGTRLLHPDTVHEAGRVQTRGRDIVLNIPMRWRLGYHHAFSLGPPTRMGFGHFGYGGSGGWADPETELALAFTTNRLWGTTTPLADTRIIRLNAVALADARRRGRR